MQTESAPLSLRSSVFGLIVLLVIMASVMVIIKKMGGVDQLQKIVDQAGPWAPVVYVVLKASTIVIAPLSGIPLKISAGALFGLRAGSIYTLLGDLIGGSINFWLARLLGQSIIARLAGKKGLTRMNDLRACFRSYVHMRDVRLTRPQLGCVPDDAA